MADLQPSDSSLLKKKWSRTGVSRMVKASPDEVWAVVSDASTWLDWYRPLSAFDLVGVTSLQPGAEVYEKESFWKTTSEVVDWDEGRTIGLSTRTINARWLLRRYYRLLEIDAADPEGTETKVSLTGGFSFGPVGWIFVAYAYPQTRASLYFEYRSALKGLAAYFSDADR